MPKKIDVDLEELEKFIQVVDEFHQEIEEKFKSVQKAWDRCDESWQGISKERFTRDFEQTQDAVNRAINAGEIASDQFLAHFQSIVNEFEDQYL
ncbi:WXG100 family type VII secretion target [Limnospira platensis]|uniref:WXG100 family type VII secretion target n=1 Tax=Limnospira platensis TaxID=118562 RepID=UPI0002804059|nr:hypothetical protein SPLC1_S090200 [Arthrospira platensis C1]UWU51009.1 WXG100 family type VII secretion target [Arthrospira platensis C1]